MKNNLFGTFTRTQLNLVGLLKASYVQVNELCKGTFLVCVCSCFVLDLLPGNRMGAWLALLFLFDTPPETLAIYREKRRFTMNI